MQITIEITLENFEFVNSEATLENHSVSELINRIIREFIQESEPVLK